MHRIQRGFHLLGASWQVLRADRELMLLPAFSMIAVLIVAMLLGGIGWTRGLFELDAEGNRSAARWLLLGVFYFFAYGIGIFFNAAIVGAATIRLQGGDPTVRDGLRMAWERFDKILGWAAIAATVGLVLHAIRERGGTFSKVMAGIAGAAWSAVTFFVIPVLLYEPLGVVGSMKRSASLFRQRWGEQFTGNGAIGLAVFCLGVPLVLILPPVWMVSPLAGLILTVLAFGALFTVASTMSGIFNAALYRYAITGEGVGPFSEGVLRGTFSARGGRGGARTHTSLQQLYASEMQALQEQQKPKDDPPEPPRDTPEQPPLF